MVMRISPTDSESCHWPKFKYSGAEGVQASMSRIVSEGLAPGEKHESTYAVTRLLLLAFMTTMDAGPEPEPAPCADNGSPRTPDGCDCVSGGWLLAAQQYESPSFAPTQRRRDKCRQIAIEAVSVFREVCPLVHTAHHQALARPRP